MEPYLKIYNGYFFENKRIYLTGRCKTRTISYKDGSEYKYQYVERRVYFWCIPLWTVWEDSDSIVWRTVTETIYKCDTRRNMD